ncbi:L-2-hydroxyglutarate oxidase [Nocardioides sp. TRM66260-LWL]|uniref:L-2-hydroxyglutarate oxidase n=1 Tax=Nocardioides sp. TRM66260-LWL TaxID=2874478 RepID=UPI001CC64915|nr:L-2-hydroxyglutarate oxidase [Nocardioides sp. TRM66260-LWL]MBZ5734771.1 L-2-hydroxyglutarate oxidase [Nocardioides sp. TRM66260-LWL]
MKPADLLVVGAGLVGLATAREHLLRHPGAQVVVVEQEAAVAAHQTGRNSGVVHGGIYYQPGSLKARLCVEGARDLYAYCEEHRLPHERCGKLIVALGEHERGRLDELERRGRANRVPGLRRVEGLGAIREIEPSATGIAALHAPNTGIVDYAAVARAVHAELLTLGADVRLATRVEGLAPHVAGAVVRTSAGDVVARRVVVCAGLWSDRLARAAGAPADPRIVPFRGAYLALRPEAVAARPVRGMVYPVPDPDLPFLGVHVTRHLASPGDGGRGAVLLGPTAMLVPARDAYRLTDPRSWRPRDAAETLAWPGTWHVARRFWRTGVHELRMAVDRRAFVAEAARYVPGLTVDDLEDGVWSAGVRAQAVGRDGALVDDFVLSRLGPVVFVRNAPSPAATSAFALARELLDRVG